LNAPDRFSAVKRRFGAAELLELAIVEGLHHRGSGRNRCECPGCRNGDPRGVSIGEKNGVGLWQTLAGRCRVLRWRPPEAA
jgi:hypothetical protein